MAQLKALFEKQWESIVGNCDEVRMLDNRYAILFIRGERPVLDDKFDLMRHPNVGLSADGQGKVFDHGEVKNAVATFTLLEAEVIQTGGIKNEELRMKNYSDFESEIDTNFELLSEEDIDELFKKIMEEN